MPPRWILDWYDWDVVILHKTSMKLNVIAAGAFINEGKLSMILFQLMNHDRKSGVGLTLQAGHKNPTKADLKAKKLSSIRPGWRQTNYPSKPAASQKLLLGHESNTLCGTPELANHNRFVFETSTNYSWDDQNDV